MNKEIDYKTHRERLAVARRSGIHAVIGVPDADILLDKAEAHDKAVEKVEKLENVIENIHAAAKDLPISYEQIIQICSELIEDPSKEPASKEGDK